MSTKRYSDRLGQAQRRGFQPDDIRPGAVFTVTDKAVYFPDETNRTYHEDRWALIVQSQYDPNGHARSLLVIPCSGSGAPAFGDVVLPQNEVNGKLFTKPSVVAYVSLLQPCPRKCLRDYKGDLQDETWGAIFARLAQLLGLSLPAPQVQIPPRL